jgi:hypothetical protein
MNVHSALLTVSRKSKHFVRELEGMITEELDLDGAARVESASVSRITADTVSLQRESGLETLQDTTSNTSSSLSVNNNGVPIVLGKIIASVNVETRGTCASLSRVIRNRVPRIIRGPGTKLFLIPIVRSWSIYVIAALSSVCR